MVAAFRARRDYVVDRLRQVEGIKLNSPDGAFYVMPGDPRPIPEVRLRRVVLRQLVEFQAGPGIPAGRPACEPADPSALRRERPVKHAERQVA